MSMGTPAQQRLGKKFIGPFFSWADDAKLRKWLREQDPDELEQFLNWFDFSNYRDREVLGRQELGKLRNPIGRLSSEGSVREDGKRISGDGTSDEQGRDIHANAFDLLKAIERATRGSAVPVVLDELRDLQMTEGEARAAFSYLKDKGWIEANYRIFYAARISAAGYDAIKAAETASIRQPRSAHLASDPVQDLAWERVRVEEAKQSKKSACEVMGLNASPAAAAMGLKEPSWPVGDGHQSASKQPQQTSAKARAGAAAGDTRPSGEVLTLKPTVYGVGVDLKELGRRLRSWWARRQGRSS
jgi:hypothetical protein